MDEKVLKSICGMEHIMPLAPPGLRHPSGPVNASNFRLGKGEMKWDELRKISSGLPYKLRQAVVERIAGKFRIVAEFEFFEQPGPVGADCIYA